MNMSKHMLRLAAALVAVAFGGKALADGITLPYAQSFEGEQAEIKAWTMDNWSTDKEEDDISEIVVHSYEFAPGAEGITYPLPEGSGEGEATHTQVLKLNTEGSTLTAELDITETSILSQAVYIDTMVQFVLSDDEPSFSGVEGLKLAVFANAESNLVVRHGTSDEGMFAVINTETEVAIDPEKWYRLTVTIKQIDEETFLQVFVNGAKVESDVNLLDGIDDASLFLAAVDFNDGAYDILQSVSFQGTGYIDDLVISRTNPFGDAGIAGYMVYVDVGANGSATINGDPVGDGYEAAAGADVTVKVTADEWYRINELVDDGTEIVAAAGEKSYEYKILNIAADHEDIAVDFVAADAGDLGVPAGVDLNWLKGYFNDEPEMGEGVANQLLKDYLLGLDPTEANNAALSISDIVYDAAEAEVTVTCLLTDGQALVDTTINGTLTIWGKENMTDENYTAIGTAAFSGAEFEDGEYEAGPFDAGNYKFFKAIIDVTVGVEI